MPASSIRAARWRAVAAALVAAALVGSGLPTAASAAALPVVRPSVRIASGDSTVAVAWGRIAAASRYRVAYSTARSMARARSFTTSGLRASVPRVTNRHRYWVRVTPILKPGVRVRAASATVSTVPLAGSPIPVTSVSARPGGPNQVVVSWSGGGKARKVAVIAGSNSITDSHHFTSAWYPATTRSITITVPAQYRAMEGAGTGNPVFVKVVQSNSASTAKHLAYNAKDQYRLSPPGTFALAGAPAATGPNTRISVGTYNVQSEPASANYSAANRWANRIDGVVATIQASRPDLLGVQELGTTRMVRGCLISRNADGSLRYCEEQYNTLAARLRSGVATPYRIADPTANAFVSQQERATGELATAESHLFYNPAKLTVVRAGFVSPTYTLGVPWNRAVVGADRIGSWAVFRINSSGREFVASSIHLTVGNGPIEAANRQQEAAALARWLDGKAKAYAPAGQTLPVVVIGDLNSRSALEDTAGAVVFRRLGYIDAASARSRSGWFWNTSNMDNGSGGSDPGYPVRAQPHKYPGSRIDYIMVKDSPYPVRYANVVRVAGGRFQPEFRGSDHNLQFAILGIGDPVRTS